LKSGIYHQERQNEIDFFSLLSGKEEWKEERKKERKKEREKVLKMLV